MILMIGPSVTFAQDIHFSQFYNSPLSLNPVLTGLMDGKVRIGANHRNQWKSFASPYVTSAAYADALWSNRLGTGIWVMKDVAGGSLSVTKIQLSASYHKLLSDEYLLSLGFGANWTQKSLDFSELTFDSQISDGGFDRMLPNGEPINGITNLNYFDLQTGLMFAYIPSEDDNIFVGAALFHGLKPKDTFYNSNNELGSRPVLHAGAQKRFNSFYIRPGLMYMNQKNAQEFVTGLSLGYDFMQSSAKKGLIFMGAWVRMFSAIIPVLGVEYEGIKVSTSYDLNIGAVASSFNTFGGPEISIMWIIPAPSKIKGKAILCPGF